METTPKIEFLGLTFDVTVMIGTLVTAILVLIIVLLTSRGRNLRPKGAQNFFEMVVEFIQGVTNMMLDSKRAAKYVGFAVTIFLFVFIGNELGVILMITAHATGPMPSLGLTKDVLDAADNSVSWFKSPTSDINVTVAMAGAIFFFSHFMGIRKSPRDYLNHYVQPYFWMLPLHLIDELAKPVTHAARLWANIFAGEVLIIILREGMWYLTGIPLIAWIGFSLFVGAIQAYIFTVLAMVYISQKIADEH
ncbi:F-type H+-transporting ATPase subunit a [Pullulanibacillus pueri]|uniref:ATP synthase subunit a n=1 Tax=Pullulanibacillus pueri TaxID=1437324 RepID=A0A8J3EMM6_9BACL|nr:F0F1 ATP synthase subunit A [Pullulanibacillus pueri]MBM7681730.1 F-type H+-transporting ATPase subunit a [Pullulanibacillus pueri]GGH84075.1 ATP synthase subunit a [Pullulanibacillus pueri]